MPLQNNTTPKKHYQPGKQIEHIYEVAQMIENPKEKTHTKTQKEIKNTSLGSQYQNKNQIPKLNQ